MDSETLDRMIALHRGLPRQAPGGREHTLRALSLVQDLPPRPRILDFGCGPGAQTIDLLQNTEGLGWAVDLLPEFLDELRARADLAGVADRLTVVCGDMSAPPPEITPQSFDLVWSEGAAYSMGFDDALKTWRRFLCPGGSIVVSELSAWGRIDEAPAAVQSFFRTEYPRMRDDAANRAAFEAAGYELTGAFRLPVDAWWDPYYAPLSERLPSFEAAFAGDDLAGEIARQTRLEIELFREHSDDYGYAFYIGKLLVDPENPKPKVP